ncbi:MAG: amidohydrolase family protein, partial [Dehalococcoidia bacterium]|nr:amidohydrolase family protein [Dehalococcoidia bacterium]
PYIDDIAADFPGLTIIMAHPAWPWVQEQLAIVVHKPNVYMDLSGYSPKYMDRSIIDYANYRTPDKMMFGSDYPFIRPLRWLNDYDNAGFRPEVEEGLLFRNAARLLGIEESFTYSGPRKAAD